MRPCGKDFRFRICDFGLRIVPISDFRFGIENLKATRIVQRTEDRGQKTEDRRQRAEIHECGIRASRRPIGRDYAAAKDAECGKGNFRIPMRLV